MNIASRKRANADIALSRIHSRKVFGGFGCWKKSGGKDDNAVVSVAVQEAPAEAVAPCGMQVTAVPRLLEPFLNWTVPVGPCVELLFEPMVAINVMLPPEVTVLGPEMDAPVVAFVIVTVMDPELSL